MARLFRIFHEHSGELVWEGHGRSVAEAELVALRRANPRAAYWMYMQSLWGDCLSWRKTLLRVVIGFCCFY